MADDEVAFRSGFVAVVGRPNTGKSTLVNTLVGNKVAITSPVPQTTRSAVRGVMTSDDAQVVLVDTPGYHKPQTLLGHRLNEVVRAAWSDVDIALFVVDAAAGIGRGDEKLSADLAAASMRVFCVVNKVDLLSRDRIAEALVRASRLDDFDEFFPTSGRSGRGVDVLRAELLAAMPPGHMYYPPGTNTDQPPPLFVAELVREKLLGLMREEVPHSIAVVTDEIEDRADGSAEIQATIYVERASQKGIVVGKGGSGIKAVGIEARGEVEALFGRRVHLHLRVRVEKDWQRRAGALQRLGFGTDR